MNATLFEQAKSKVENSNTLKKYASKILADWNGGDAHWQWVIESSDDEIVDWAVAGLHESEVNEMFG